MCLFKKLNLVMTLAAEWPFVYAYDFANLFVDLENLRQSGDFGA